jgi:hypothetical protein
MSLHPEIMLNVISSARSQRPFCKAVREMAKETMVAIFEGATETAPSTSGRELPLVHFSES